MPARNPDRERALARILTDFNTTENTIVRRRKERKISIAEAESNRADNLMHALTRLFAATRPTRKEHTP